MKNLRGEQRKEFENILNQLEKLEKKKSVMENVKKEKTTNMDFPTQPDER